MLGIHEMVEQGDISGVRSTLKTNPGQVHKKYSKGIPDQPIHAAALHGRIEIARLLLKAGADPNARGDLGRTPVYRAVDSQNPRMVRLLVKEGARLDIPNDYDQTPLYFAASTDDDDMVKLLLQLGAVPDIRSLMYVKGPEHVLELLKKSPRRLKKTLSSHPGLLYDAIRCGASELLEFLLTNGVDPNTILPDGDPFLVEAITTSCDFPPAGRSRDDAQYQLVHLLLSHGADVGAKDQTGRSLLQTAKFYRCSRKITKLLKSHGAS